MPANRTTADAPSPPAPGLRASVADMVAELRRGLWGGYRPERHYMRGPGPAWQAKQAPT
jgi:hypothetical protein